MNRDRLREDLIRDEGLRAKPYRCPAGKLTIGVGHNIEDNGLPAPIIEALLDHDIATSATELDRAIPWWRTLPEPAQRALVNMHFNMGWPRLSQFKRMLRALEARDWQGAAIEARNSAWAGQVGARAHRIAALFAACGQHGAVSDV
jgi:lysozyme